MNKLAVALLTLGILAAGVWTVFFINRDAQPALVTDQDKPKDDKEKKRKPRFTIGKETTYVDGPVDEDGYIDYAAALNKRLSEGVTPENNAAVLLWKAFGPKDDLGSIPPEFFALLGMEALPEEGDYLIGLTRFAKEHFPNDPNWLDDMERTERRPWLPKDYPNIAAWVTASEKPLAKVAEASKRSRYYSPFVPSAPKQGLAGSMGASITGISKCRSCASLLTVRAMLRLGQERYDEAWRDLLTCHRLGRIVAQGSMLIEGLSGTAMDRVAGEADLAFLEKAKVDAKNIKACLRDLQQLPPIPPMADKLDLSERLFILDTIMMLDRNGLKSLEGLYVKVPESLAKLIDIELPDPTSKHASNKIDWDAALRNANRWHDRIVLAMCAKDRNAREEQFDQIEEDLAKLKKASADTAAFVNALKGAKRPAEFMGKHVGEVLISSFPELAHKVRHSEDRDEQMKRNLHLAFALAAYHRDHGRYPMKLEALAPKYLAEIPVDVFSGKAIIYRTSKDGYWLQSFGPNGKDDEGRDHLDDPPGDDCVIQMPLPKLRLFSERFKAPEK